MASVSDDDFDREYRKLLEALDRAVALLRDCSVDFWADWLESDRRKIAEGDRYALEHLLMAFGGMGSFNDLVIHPLSGHVVDDVDVDRVNRELTTHRSEIWSAAKAMKRELDRS
jgi:hypothetical protein